MIDFSYLEPPRRAYKIKRLSNFQYMQLEQYQFEHINSKPYRRIFDNVQYNEEQKQQINKFKDYLKEKQPTKQYGDSFLLKMMYLTNDAKVLEVFDKIKKYQDWHQNPIICKDNEKARRILEDGVFYQYGRDYEFSPVVYVYPCRVQLNKYELMDYFSAIYTLFTPIQQFMLIGGIIQSWNIIVDFQNKSMNLPTSFIKENVSKILNAYPFRLKQLFFLNYNDQNSLQQLLKQSLRQFNCKVKPQILKSVSQLRHFIPDQQRQKKYGGSLQNLNQYWPISSTNKYQQQKSYVLVPNLDETQFQSVMNDEIFFQQNEQNGSVCSKMCGGDNCQIY